MDAGADVCVVSVHKMGMGFEQGSVFHVQGDLVDPARLSACADLLMTTSPNVLIYSAIDGWRRQMVRDGAATAFVSAGHTGATMAGATLILGRIRGIERPALAAVFPSHPRPILMLDVGASVEIPAGAPRSKIAGLTIS